MDNADLAVKLQKVDDRSQRNEGRIKKLEETQTALNELALSVKELATDQMNMKKDIVEIKTDVKALTSIPSKRWEAIVEKVVLVVVGAVIAFILGKIGISEDVLFKMLAESHDHCGSHVNRMLCVWSASCGYYTCSNRTFSHSIRFLYVEKQE